MHNIIMCAFILTYVYVRTQYICQIVFGHICKHTCEHAIELTLSTAVDSRPVDPPFDALSGHPPVSDGDTAVTQHVLEVAGAALVIGTGSHRSGVGPESLTAIEILLVFLQDLEKRVEGANTYAANMCIYVVHIGGGMVWQVGGLKAMVLNS